MRRALVATCCFLFPVGAVVSCLDPSQDFSDWLTRSADARAGTSMVSDASFEAELDGGFDQTYVMACLPSLAGGDTTKVLLFDAHVVFHQSGGTGNGTLDITQTALVAGSTDTTKTIGMPVTVTGTAVMGGMAAVMFGMTTIPGEADTILPGTPIVFSSSTLNFDIGSPTQICAGLSGMVTMPAPMTLDKSQNICVLKVPMGTTVPTYGKTDFHCP
jgi:hypothetical protein